MIAEEESRLEAERDSRYTAIGKEIAGYVGITKDPELTILMGNIRRVLYEERRIEKEHILKILREMITPEIPPLMIADLAFFV